MAEAAGGASAEKTEAGAVGGGDLCAALRLQHWQRWFDVDAGDVAARLWLVARPWEGGFFEALGTRPDLYGPFWVCATLVFLVAATANLSSFVAHAAAPDSAALPAWEQDLDVLPLAAVTVFCFAAAMPLVCSLSLRVLGVGGNTTLIELICLYGYSIAPFCPCCLLCALPVASLQWASVGLALAASSLFLVNNLWHRLDVEAYQRVAEVADADAQAQRPTGAAEAQVDEAIDRAMQAVGCTPARRAAGLIVVVLTGLHVAFALVLKVRFFGGL